MRTMRAWTYFGLVAAAWLAPAGAAMAGKPGGGGGGAVDGGVVYFRITAAGSSTLMSMNPDGSGKSATLTTGAGSLAVSTGTWVPSRTLHAGHRWFLEAREISGQTYPGSTLARREWFAVRGDGAVVAQLTDQADLAPLGACWAPDDAAISWVGSRYSGGVAGPRAIYVATLAYDAAGDVTGLAFQPSAPTVTISGSSTEAHDWAPDGSRMVVQGLGAQLWIAHLPTGAVTAMQRSVKGNRTEAVLGVAPTWSPDGARIAFHLNGEIRSVAPDGSGLSTLVGGGGMSSAQWSPHGTLLVFLRTESLPSGRRDVCRVAAGGGTATNLTADLDTRPTPYGGVGDVHPLGWR